MRVHILQKGIIDKLRRTDALRYSELQPGEIESSHFKYHLDQLIKDKLVERYGRGIYGLTAKGRAFTDRISDGLRKPSEMPKLITYTLLEDDDMYYFMRKDREPYRGLINMIGGKMHIGETADVAARREIYEKVGLVVTDVSLCGVANIRVYEQDSLLTHAVAYIYRTHVAEVPANLMAIKKSELSGHSDLAPDLPLIIKHIASDEPPFVISLRLNL